jgi:uncharacterized protein YjeT (DUF2065 family)
MNWDLFFSALALMLVFEGMMPFISPRGWRQTMQQASQLPDNVLRVLGLSSMVLGVIVLYMVG